MTIKSAHKPLKKYGFTTQDLESYSLTFAASNKQGLVVQAPPAGSPAELKRIQDWLSFQLLVQEPSPN